MKWFSGLSTIALAGALLATPAYTHDRAPGASASSLSYGEALSIQDAQNRAVLAEWSAMARDTLGASIEGHVAAVDHDSGRLVLDTDEGFVRVVTSPRELTNVEIGDLIRVSFVEDSD